MPDMFERPSGHIPERPPEPISLEDATEAINKLTSTQDYQTEPSVGGSIHEGSSNVADIRSIELLPEGKLEVELKRKPMVWLRSDFKGRVDLKEVLQKIRLSGF